MISVNFGTIKISDKDRKALSPLVASWRSLHPAMKQLEDSEENLTKLIQMLSMEMERGEAARQQMLSRLHMKINGMRRKLEMRKVIGATSIKPTVHNALRSTPKVATNGKPKSGRVSTRPRA